MLATLSVGCTRIGYFLFWVVPLGALDLNLTVEDRRRALGLIALFVVVATPLSRYHSRQAFRPVERWLNEQRPATPEEQHALLDQPRRQTLSSLSYWVAGGTTAGLNHVLFFDGEPVHAIAIAFGVIALGLHVAAFVYLLLERLLQPVVARAIGAVPEAHLMIVNVRNRFLLAWALGAGVSMTGIAMFLSLRTSADIGPAIWPIVLLAFVEGYLLVSWAARSVTEPITKVRAAMRRVMAGDLDAEVPVDAGSEVALLQLGFNQMVAGLRDREQMRKLLGQHVGVDVARRALETGADFSGVECDATVLVVDLIGSTPFAQARPTPEVLVVLNRLFDTVVRVVGQHGGWVNRFAGDAAFCLFGAPAPLPAHAERALRAARQLHEEVAELRRRESWLDAGIGVSSGTLLAASVGTAERHEFSVIGDPANEASRLTDEAKRRPGRILASASAIAAAPGEASAWVSAGRLTLRGRSEATEVFEPVSAVVDDAAMVLDRRWV